MFKKNDPLVGDIKKIMQENEQRRQVEAKLCEELGIASRKALPFEHHANYDALLEQRIAEAKEGSVPTTPKEKALAKLHGDPNKITHGDVLKGRGVIEGKKMYEEEDDKSVQGSGAVTKDGKDVVSPTAPKAEGPSDKERAALTNKVKEIMKEYVELDESVVVSTTHHKDADGNKTWNVSHKKKKIGSITVDKTGSWSYEHEPSGNYEDGYESKKEAVKELKDTHKYHQKLIKSGEIPDNLKEASYSAKEARAGKDIGKPGKNFEKIAKSAAKRYGSEERGKKVAGAILAKLRSKNMKENAEQIDEVSRKTLHSYVNKAIDKVKSGEEPEGKRAKGLRKATTKLYKVDEAEEEKSVWDKIKDVTSDYIGKNIKVYKKGENPEEPKSNNSSPVAPTDATKPATPEVAKPKKSEFNNPVEPETKLTGARSRLTSGEVDDREKESANWERFNRVDIESRKKALKTRKELDDIAAQEKAYAKEREDKGLAPKKYKWEETSINGNLMNEKAPPGAKYERMVKHIKAKYGKDGLTDKEKSIAYATAWKAKNKEEMKEAVEAELRKNLGEKFDEIVSEERDDETSATPKVMGPGGAKGAEPGGIFAKLGSAVSSAFGGTDKGAETTPAPKPAAAQPPETKASPEDRAAFQSRTAQSPETKATPADREAFKQRTGQTTPAPEKPEASGRENVPGPNDRPAATPRPAAPKPVARPAAPAAPKAAAPAAPSAPKPTGPVSGPGAEDDNTSPLGALRQYQASKEAGNFDNKPAASAAPAARPAAPRTATPAARPSAPASKPAISAPTGSAAGTSASTSMAPSGFKPTAPNQRLARGGMMAESLETTIRKMLKD